MNEHLAPLVWTALVTPFTEEGQIDYESVKQLIQMQNAAGNGLFIAGSTGEGLAMPFEMKKQYVKFVSKQPRDVPLMIGVSGACLDHQIEWITFCNALQVDAYNLVTPYYSKPAYHGQKAWFEKLMEHANVPCMLYNIPSRSATSLSVDLVRDLSHHEKLFAVKESSGDIDEFRSYRRAAPNLLTYCGNDLDIFEQAHLGAAGLVSVMSNAYPFATKRLVELSKKGSMNDFISDCLDAGIAINTQNPLPIKILLYKKGLLSSPTFLPPLSSKDLTNEKALLQSEETLQRLESEQALQPT